MPSFPINQVLDEHVTRYGVIQVPYAGLDGQPCAIIKLHGAYQYRIVRFVVQGRGAEPPAPSNAPKFGEVLKYEKVRLRESQPQIGDNPGAASPPTDPPEAEGSGYVSPQDLIDSCIYTVSGIYVFLKAVPVTMASGMWSYPQAPADYNPPQTRSVDKWLATLTGSDAASSQLATQAEAPE